jgi:hypothetical protein
MKIVCAMNVVASAGEGGLAARSVRPPTERTCMYSRLVTNVRGRLPRTTGYQPVLPCAPQI